MRSFQIELSTPASPSEISFTSGDKVSGTGILTSSKNEVVGTVDIIFRGRTKSQVVVEQHAPQMEINYNRYHGQATMFEFIEPLHRGYSDSGANPWTESDSYVHRAGHTLPPTFSTEHDGGRFQKDNYICYELEAILTRPVSTFSFLKWPLKCRVDLQFTPSRVIEDPDPYLFCEEQTFTRQSRRLDPSTEGRWLSLKAKARAPWAPGDQPKATFVIKVEIPQVGYISGPLDIFLGIKHDRANSTATALPIVNLNRVRVRLLATTYARCPLTGILDKPELGELFNTRIDVLDHLFSQTPMAENMNMMQLCPALQLGRQLAPTFSTYNLAREYRLEVNVTVECAHRTFKAEFGGHLFLVLPEVVRCLD